MLFMKSSSGTIVERICCYSCIPYLCPPGRLALTIRRPLRPPGVLPLDGPPPDPKLNPALGAGAPKPPGVIEGAAG